MTEVISDSGSVRTAYDPVTYARHPAGPIMPGDTVEDNVVVGFAYICDGKPDPRNDQLLFEGDEALESPPRRPVPGIGDGVRVQQTGQLPPHELASSHFIQAADIPELADAVQRTLLRKSKEWSKFVLSLFACVSSSGDLIWLAGGAVRDLVLDRDADPKDLDLAGTAPPGRFTTSVEQTLAIEGASDLRYKISPASLVCSLAEPRSGGRRLLEYRTLINPRFLFPACGSSFRDDLQTRDLTVNCLFYDVERDLLLDPTGRGLADLRAPTRRLSVVNGTSDVSAQAIVVLRAMKFILRWRATGLGCDTSELRQWVQDRDPSLLLQIADEGWRALLSRRRACVGRFPVEDQLLLAVELGPFAAALFDELESRQQK